MDCKPNGKIKVKGHPFWIHTLGSLLLWGSGWLLASPALSLPPPEDIPEEILRAQPNLSSRSALDNAPLSPSERAMGSPAERSAPIEIAPELQQLIFLLRVRQAYLRIFPPRPEPSLAPRSELAPRS